MKRNRLTTDTGIIPKKKTETYWNTKRLLIQQAVTDCKVSDYCYRVKEEVERDRDERRRG